MSGEVLIPQRAVVRSIVARLNPTIIKERMVRCVHHLLTKGTK